LIIGLSHPGLCCFDVTYLLVLVLTITLYVWITFPASPNGGCIIRKEMNA